MNTLNENIESKDSKMSNGIKAERFEALKGNYQKPEMSTISSIEFIDGCSDMAVCHQEGGY